MTKDKNTRPPGYPDDGELFWIDHYKWLQQRGYTLRPRYNPGWKPSWEGTKKKHFKCEDGVRPLQTRAMDARRNLDGAAVMIKRSSKKEHPYEADIGFPIYEVLQAPEDDDLLLLVMPRLRKFGSPRFDTIGEIVDFLRQVFEGMQFMHSHKVAHRDCTSLNIMMDPTKLYPYGYHPVRLTRSWDLSRPAKHYTRTQKPVKYYLTDFGLSRRYKPEETSPLEPPIRGADKSVPEFKNSDTPCDPFPTDVYYLGNMIRETFTEGCEFSSKHLGLDFLKPLVADMVRTDPLKRPTMDEVVSRFNAICGQLGSWKLRSRIVRANDGTVENVVYSFSHWRRRLEYLITNVPPVPLLP